MDKDQIDRQRNLASSDLGFSAARGSRATTVQRREPLSAKVGLLAVGHHTYWPQFPGLLDEMHRKIGVLAGRLQAHGVEVENFGLLDNAPAAWAALPKVK